MPSFNWERHFRGMTKPKVKYSKEYSFGSDYSNDFGVLMPDSILMSDNLIATDNYFHQTALTTDQAKTLASSWAQWWNTTGNPDNYWFSIPQEVWDEARNRKNAFDIANNPPDQTARIIAEQKTDLSTEQMRGQPDRRDPSTGNFPVPPPPSFLQVPPWVKPVAIVALAAGVGLSALPMIRKILFPV